MASLNCTQDNGQWRKKRPPVADRVKEADIPQKWTNVGEKSFAFQTWGVEAQGCVIK